jgi:hypothetical protein
MVPHSVNDARMAVIVSSVAAVPRRGR